MPAAVLRQKMQRLGSKFLAAVACLAGLAFPTLVEGQSADFTFPAFDSAAGLLLHGAAASANSRLRLTPASEGRVGGAWFATKRFVEAGFETTFQFQITAPGGQDNGTPGGEGFAFVIQNNSAPALGPPGGKLGYDGIFNSVAIEFDTRQNTNFWDQAANHVSVQTHGIYANAADYGACRGSVARNLPNFADGGMHTATIAYAPGALRVFLDDLTRPVLTVDMDLAATLQLDNGQAWIGFTAATGSGYQNHDILNWSFAPASLPVNVALAGPADGASFVCPATIELAASASAGTGSVTRVEFFQGSTKLGEALGSPYRFTWTNVVPGTYWLTALATDDAGRRSVSPPAQVLVLPVGPAIGINFAAGLNGAVNYLLGDTDRAGVVVQSNWNNVISPTNGVGAALNLRDGAGGPTAVAVSFNCFAVGEETNTNPALSPNHTLMKGYVADFGWPPGRSNSTITVSQVPYPVYDVIVHSDSSNEGQELITEFRIGGRSIFMRDAAWAGFSGFYAPADSTADLGVHTAAGNYVRFRGLTNAGFTLVVTSHSSINVNRRSAVNAIQIVPSVRDSTPAPVQLLRGPYLQLGTPTSIVVCWRTDLPTDSQVRYGLEAGALSGSAVDTNLTTEHFLRLTNLLPGTRYYYAIGSTTTNLAGGDQCSFVTGPTAAKPTRIWVLGDSGTGDYNAAAVRDAFEAFAADRPADFWVMLGDNAYDTSSDADYQTAVFDMYPAQLRQAVLWATLGNHDTYTLSMPFLSIFMFPTNGEAGGVPSGSELYYSFNYGNIHFVCLDSALSDRSTNGPMLTWLQADLAANTNQWLIAFWHHPPYSKGGHDSDMDYEIEMIGMRENALPILEAYGVDLVLNGHSHSYERSFFMDGHYGFSDTFTSTMIRQPGSGRTDDAGPYTKAAAGQAPHQGAVYVVAGSSGKVSPDWGLNHPAINLAWRHLGSLVLDIDGPRLDVKFLRENGTVADYFTLLKDTPPNPLPTVSVVASEPVASETYAVPATFTVSRTGPTDRPLPVFYTLSGTAKNGADYLQLPGAVTIPAGAEIATVDVNPVDDPEVEGPENVVLNLESNTAPFRLVVLPDTRSYTAPIRGGTLGMLTAQTAWIAEHKDALNLAFVLQTGDVTENNLSAEWKRARTSFGLLDGVVPYAVAVGDHDGLDHAVGQTALYNFYFPVSESRSVPGFGGVFESNKLDNCYYYFSAGGVDWLVLVLEFGPRDAVLEWANQVVARHYDRKVIVLIHAHVYADDALHGLLPSHLETPTDFGRKNNGPEVWDKFLRRHPNLALVLNGHAPGDGVGRRVDLGDYGNGVFQVAANYAAQLNGGNGYLRLLEFQPAQDRMVVTTYSPYLQAYLTDAQNQFTFENLGLFKPQHARYQLAPGQSAATVTILDNDVDTTPPTVLAVTATGSPTNVVVVFSEPVERTSAESLAHYSLGGIRLGGATLCPDGRTVVLTTLDPLTDGGTYTLAVTQVSDRAIPSNVLAPGAQAVFVHRRVFLAADFEGGNVAGWQVVDEGTLDGPSIWRAPAGRLDQSSAIHGPDDAATERRQGTYAYWSDAAALGWSNYTFSAILHTPSDGGIGVLFRYQNPANYYKLELDERRHFRKLLAWVNGVETLLAGEAQGYATNTDLELKLEVAGNRIFATLDRVPLFGGIITNGALARGTVAVYCWDSPGVTFDEVVVAPWPSNAPPAVALTNPTNGAAVVAPADLTLTATASDPDGISQVRFFAGTNLLGTVTNGPAYSLSWSNVPAGDYTITAQAADTRGFWAVSSPARVVCRLLADEFNGGLTGWTVVDEGTLQAPSQWSVSGGKLYQWSNIYGPADVVDHRKGTYVFWSPTEARWWADYTFSATLRSADDDGIGVLFRYQDPANYYKVELDQQRNFRKLLKMVAGVETTLATETGGYPVNADLNVVVEATGAQIRVTLNGAPLFGGSVNDGSLRLGTVGLYSWASAGVAFDAVMVTARSAPDVPPAVAIVSPADGAAFTAPAIIPLTAEATDPDGTVRQVDFFLGQTWLGTITNRPYSLVWSNAGVGTYTFTARATDNLGAQMTSAPANILVVYPEGFPRITNQPQNQMILAGESLTLSVGAEGTSPLHFQWRFNETNLAGATTPVLMISNAQPADAGTYRVAISNVYGAIVSAAAVVNVASAGSPILRRPEIELPDRFRFQLAGPTNRVYVIEALSDLASWVPLATLTNTSGTAGFTDTVTTNLSRRFYRARLLP